MTLYQEFVARKLALHPPTGIDRVPELHESLFPHQRDLVRWALMRGRAAIFANTGLGKTAMQLEWARVVCETQGGSVLVLAPLAVAEQTVKEGRRIGVDVTLCREASDVRPGVNVTNYDRLHRFDPSAFVGVVLDECFAPGTMIETVDARGAVQSTAIETIRAGDFIRNAVGVDMVADVHRREVPYAVRVVVGDQSIIASPNHPFFTQRGWVGSCELMPGDSILRTQEAVRVVRGDVRACVEAGIAPPTAEVLRSILLSEMAHEHAGAQGEGAQHDERHETRAHAVGAVRCERSSASEEQGEDQGAQSHFGPDRKGEDLPPVERDEARTFRAWGQRSWFDRAAEDDARCTRTDLGGGIQFLTGPTDSGVSIALQTRSGAAREENRRRSGWVLSRESEASGREEGCEVVFARVDRVEILECGHPELERLRSPDGKLYFYDLGATRHPSYSVGGLLVHNSSVIKHHDASTLRTLLDAFARTAFKLCATATPAPNDWTELGTHAEFLGICTRTEMLSEFFCHDGGETQAWRLKGHARAQFWRWVASWGALVQRPSDLGYDDAGYALPALTVEEHVILCSRETATNAGVLFVSEAKSLMDRRAARKASTMDRVTECARMVNADDLTGEPWIVWCDLNAESEALAKAIPGAVEVRGSDPVDVKAERLRAFSEGRVRVLVTKPSIAGFGLNWQHCARVAFVGVTDSWESYYQAVRRCWRFGQSRPVAVHIFASEAEGAVLANLRRKEEDARRMGDALAAETSATVRAAVLGAVRETNTYAARKRITVPQWLKTEEVAA